jgi:acyl-CoA synthetase (AMP-forming)/AMP-acid ligase II
MNTAPIGEWRSIPAMIDAAVDRFGSKAALIDGETRLSYVELAEQARMFGAALVASGIEPGDRVAVWAFNSAEWVVAALGIFGTGAVLVPINTRFKGAEAADILLRSRAKVLVTVTDFLGTDYVAMLKDTGVDLPELTTTVIARGTPEVGTDSWGDFLAGATDVAGTEVDRRSAAVEADDPSDILFTSGTTGFPKGVVQTHGRTLCVATDWVAMTRLNANDRYLMVNPYFHMFGLKAGILASVCAGATMFPQAVFDVEVVLSMVAEKGVTVLPGPPTLYQGILDHPKRDDYNLSTLRVAVTGAADIPVELIRRIDSELPFSLIVTGYGLTETGTAAATLPGDDVETIATTVGCPRPGFELRIIDGEGSEVSHYLDDPVATAQALSSDGWLRTGDIGTVDPSGYLRIVGRSKDMFIVGGFNAYPAEIENFLLDHPDIQQAAVIGIPDERLGEVGMAFVVMKPDCIGTEADIIDWSRDRMANFKVPRVVEFVDGLPLNATGKVVKTTLRERVARRDDGAGS